MSIGVAAPFPGEVETFESNHEDVLSSLGSGDTGMEPLAVPAQRHSYLSGVKSFPAQSTDLCFTVLETKFWKPVGFCYVCT